MKLFRKIEKQEPTAMEIRNKCRQNGCIFLMSAKKIILILQYLFVCGSPKEIMRIIAITVMHHAIQPGSLKCISFSKQLISVWINSHLSHVTPVWTKLLVGAQAKIWAPYPETVIGTSSKGSPRAPLGTCLNTFLLIPVLSFHASLPCSH